jgi:hypothetical protein
VGCLACNNTGKSPGMSSVACARCAPRHWALFYEGKGGHVLARAEVTVRRTGEVHAQRHFVAEVVMPDGCAMNVYGVTDAGALIEAQKEIAQKLGPYSSFEEQRGPGPAARERAMREALATIARMGHADACDYRVNRAKGCCCPVGVASKALGQESDDG